MGGRSHLTRTATALVVAVGCAAALGGCIGGSTHAGPSRGRTGYAAASCAAPALTVATPSKSASPGGRTLGPVERGRRLVLVGRFYLSGCNDTGSGALPPPISSVELSLTTARKHTFLLATVTPDSDGSFAAAVRIPTCSPLGSATIADGLAAPLRLTVVA